MGPESNISPPLRAHDQSAWRRNLGNYVEESMGRRGSLLSHPRILWARLHKLSSHCSGGDRLFSPLHGSTFFEVHEGQDRLLSPLHLSTFFYVHEGQDTTTLGELSKRSRKNECSVWVGTQKTIGSEGIVFCPVAATDCSLCFTVEK